MNFNTSPAPALSSTPVKSNRDNLLLNLSLDEQSEEKEENFANFTNDFEPDVDLLGQEFENKNSIENNKNDKKPTNAADLLSFDDEDEFDPKDFIGADSLFVQSSNVPLQPTRTTSSTNPNQPNLFASFAGQTQAPPLLARNISTPNLNNGKYDPFGDLSNFLNFDSTKSSKNTAATNLNQKSPTVEHFEQNIPRVSSFNSINPGLNSRSNIPQSSSTNNFQRQTSTSNTNAASSKPNYSRSNFDEPKTSSKPKPQDMFEDLLGGFKRTEDSKESGTKTIAQLRKEEMVRHFFLVFLINFPEHFLCVF